jgi:hypothetical protein
VTEAEYHRNELFVWSLFFIGLVIVPSLLVLLAIDAVRKFRTRSRRGFEVKPITDSKSVPETKEEQA